MILRRLIIIPILKKNALNLTKINQKTEESVLRKLENGMNFNGAEIQVYLKEEK